LFFSDKLGNLTVALGVAGAISFKVNFILQVGYHVWRFYNGDRVQLGGIKGDVDIGVLRTTIMGTGNGLTAICITAECIDSQQLCFKEPI
jgi:hypothetical protein